MKKLIPTYILTFVLSFMLFIYEPITMFATNINDFWFDMSLLLKSIFLIFIVSFVGISIFFTLLYFITNKFKKNKIYNIFVIIFLCVFLCLYIHGNFYAGKLPSLDGTKIVWGDYNTQNIISIIICLVVFVVTIILSKKFTLDKVINNSKYVVLTVFAMLSTSLLTTLLTTPNLWDSRINAIATNKNINNISSDKNFFILLVDAVDSQTLKKELNNSQEYKNLFEDFTYFEDTLAGYPFTRDSIPFILSGNWNKNEKDFYSYSTNAYNNSKLFKELEKKEYNLNLYENELIWNDKKVSKISNVKISSGIKLSQFLKQIIKYDLFKYAPYPLKKYSKIETMEFYSSKNSSHNGIYEWYDVTNYQNMINNEFEIVDEKIFSFIHLEGAHVPLNLDKNLKHKENGTYEEKVQATMKIIKTYLDRIKESGKYDNSVIIVMADHGFNDSNVNGRQNPILFIKGINEKHDMYTSDIPVSHEDLIDAYMDLLNNKKSDELFENIDSNRVRTYLWYEYTKEDNMIEYETKGKAWDTDSLYKTGKEYNR